MWLLLTEGMTIFLKMNAETGNLPNDPVKFRKRLYGLVDSVGLGEPLLIFGIKKEKQ